MKEGLRPVIKARFADSMLESCQLTGKGDGYVLHFSHNGESMHPVLRELDLLEIVPYGDRKVNSGDVIVFKGPDRDNHTVHRVVRVNPRGIATRGDNNSQEDPWLLARSDITGKVVAVWRGQKRRIVQGGSLGRIMAILIRIILSLDRSISRLLRPIYSILSERCIFLRTLPSSFRPRIVRYQSNNQFYLRLQLRGRLIGEYDPLAEEWRIRRPFKLFVDEKALPHPQGAREQGCKGAISA